MRESLCKKVKFVAVTPATPSYTYMFMLEAMTYKVVLTIEDKEIDPCQILVQSWTSQCDRYHGDGRWHSIELPYIGKESHGQTTHYFYGQSDIITSDHDFEFTYRVTMTGSDDELWANNFGVNGFVHVESPRLHDRWTLGPDFTPIIGGVHLGNFIAATNAIELGFTHVLNVADNLDMVYTDPLNTDMTQFPVNSSNSGTVPKQQTAVVYRKIAMRDGAHNPIEKSLIADAVEWLLEADGPGVKILVNCRAGIGRAGSVVVAYVFATNRSLSFNDAYQFVFSKRFVYPHAGLSDILYDLYPRV